MKTLLAIFFSFSILQGFAQEEIEAVPPPQEDEFIEHAEFLGGAAAMKQFILENIKYPKKAIRNNIQDKISVGMEIDEKGKVSNVHLLSRILNCKECDKAIIKVVKSLPEFSPAKRDGKAVPSKLVIIIPFNMN